MCSSWKEKTETERKIWKEGTEKGKITIREREMRESENDKKNGTSEEKDVQQ